MCALASPISENSIFQNTSEDGWSWSKLSQPHFIVPLDALWFSPALCAGTLILYIPTNSTSRKKIKPRISSFEN